MRISDIRLLRKEGGKSGLYEAEGGPGARRENRAQGLYEG
jgi:hypothetical protein